MAKSLGWRLLGEPHHFRAARIRVSGGRPECGAGDMAVGYHLLTVSIADGFRKT